MESQFNLCSKIYRKFWILIEDFVAKNEEFYLVKMQEDIEKELKNIAVRILVLNRNLFSKNVTDIPFRKNIDYKTFKLMSIFERMKKN